MKRLAVLGFLAFALVLSGCSAPAGLTGGSGSADAVVMKSVDGGATYEVKGKVSDKQSLGGEVLSLLVDRSDTKRIFAGMRDDGIHRTEDGAETWKKLEYPPAKVYGLAQDPIQPAVIYATGEWQGRGKVYRSDDSGAKWKEIYTEPATGTVLTALTHHPSRSGIVLVGSSTGVVVRTDDSGATWSNVGTLSGNFGAVSGAVTQLSFDFNRPDWAYAVVQNKNLARSRDGGHSFELIPVVVKTDKPDDSIGAMSPAALNTVSVTTFAVDTRSAGMLYAGTEQNGLLKSADGGDTWREVPVIDSAKKYPVRSIAVSPFDSNEIIFGGALALYRSTNGGTNWSVFQIDTKKTAGVIRYDTMDRSVIYLGFRSF